MSLLKQVKVGNVTNLSEARYCAGMGVDYLSFPIVAVDPVKFKEITGWVSGPKFGIEMTEQDNSIINSYQPDFIEVSIENLTEAFKDTNIIVKTGIHELHEHREKLILHKDRILFLEIDSADLTALHHAIDEVKEDFKVFVKFTSGSIQDYLKLPIDGISLNGNAEERPGLKEYPLAEILEQMEVLD